MPYYHRDNQRSRVYAWERKVGLFKPNVSLSQMDCVKLANNAYNKYVRSGSPALEIQFKPSRSRSSAYGLNKLIINSRGLQAEQTLHEVAHCIMQSHTGANHEPHGPAWVATYIILLHEYCGKDIKELVASARMSAVSVWLESSPIFGL